MTALIVGLVLFLGAHSVRIFAEPWRKGVRARLGENAYKGLYSLLSLAGLALIVWGYGQARQQPFVLWPALPWMRHLTALLVLVAFVLLASAYVPRNLIKGRLHHPMVMGVKTWAFAHLLANNTLADVLLFGSFLVWALLNHRAARQRDEVAHAVYARGGVGATVVAVVVGVVAWVVFAFWLHLWLIGVRPMG